jgi:hypothetical protein
MPSRPEVRKLWVSRNLANAVALLNAMKLEAGCADCGYAKHPSALQFDHRDPATKRSEPGWVEDRSKLTTAARLARYVDHVRAYCDIRCANCHAERTARERHWLPPQPTEHTSEPALF